jgi:hypothetical protein
MKRGAIEVIKVSPTAPRTAIPIKPDWLFFRCSEAVDGFGGLGSVIKFLWIQRAFLKRTLRDSCGSV